MSNEDRKTLNFQNVNANDITDNLTIRVASVNGTDAETAAINGVLQIRAITKSEADIYDSFRFSRGEVRGFANRHAENPKDLVIPDAIWGDPVLSIGKEAFKNAGLTSLVIPRSVNYIGEEAFLSNDLRSVTIGANVDMAHNSLGVIRHEGVESGRGQRLEGSGYISFRDCYNKTAGVYIYGNGCKSYVERRKAESEQELKRAKRLIRLGARFSLGGQMLKNVGSELFDKSYANHGKMEIKDAESFHLIPGLTLGLRITDNIFLATELNYNLVFNHNFWYGRKKEDEYEHFAEVSMSYQTIEVPVLLRRWSNHGGVAGLYIEAGFQFGFPISSKATASNGSEFPGSPFKDEYSDFRVKTDYGPIFGLGMGGGDFSIGLRLTYPLTKLDRYGTIKVPLIGSFTLAYDIF